MAKIIARRVLTSHFGCYPTHKINRTAVTTTQNNIFLFTLNYSECVIFQKSKTKRVATRVSISESEE